MGNTAEDKESKAEQGTNWPASTGTPMVALEDYDYSRLRKQLGDWVQAISTVCDSACPQLESLLSFLVPQNHSSAQHCLGLIFMHPSALKQKVTS